MAIDATLRVIALLLLASAALVMALRHQLVRRGLMAPLSLKGGVDVAGGPSATAHKVM